MLDSPCPQTLLEMQTWFANIITSPFEEMDQANLPIYQNSLITEIRKRIAPSPHLNSEERLGIYHQQYWWRLISIMQELYPSLVRIFDYEDFNRLIAEPYLISCPPKEWFLSHIGLELPNWLKKNYRKKNSALIIGLAHLDLAYERLIFTNLLPIIELVSLHKCETEMLYLQPFVMPFELDVDLFTFRSQLLEYSPAHWKTNKLPRISKTCKKRYFVLFRSKNQDIYEQISPSRFALLKRFQQGAKLIEILPLLAECEQVVEWFQIIASRGWLSFFNNHEEVLCL